MNATDPYKAMLRAERAQKYFEQAAAPFRRQMAEVAAIHQRIRILIHADGSTRVETWLPPEAEALMESLKKMVELCRDMADQEARTFYP